MEKSVVDFVADFAGEVEIVHFVLVKLLLLLSTMMIMFNVLIDDCGYKNDDDRTIEIRLMEMRR